MTRRETAARAMFKHRYPNDFGANRQSWDALAKEAASEVSHRAGHIAHTGPKRAQTLLDMFLDEADIVLDALDATPVEPTPPQRILTEAEITATQKLFG